MISKDEHVAKKNKKVVTPKGKIESDINGVKEKNGYSENTGTAIFQHVLYI